MKADHSIRYFLFTLGLGVIATLGLLLGWRPATAQPGQVVRVGFFQNTPLTFESNGRPTGFHLELLREIARREGWVLEVQHSGSLKNVVQGLELGTLDLGMGLAPTEALRRSLDFSLEKNAQLAGQVFIREGRAGIQEIKDLNDRKVGLLNHDALGQICAEVSKKLGLAPDFFLINSYEEMAQAVATAAVDAAVFNSAQGKDYAKLYHLRPTKIVFKPVDALFAVAKGKNSGLLEAVDRSLGQWKKEKGSTYHTLERTFLNGKSSAGGGWTKRDMLIASCLCLLFIVMGVNMGTYLVKAAESNSLRVSGASRSRIGLFTIVISIAFWGMDSLAGWLLFNADKNLSLLEFAITRVPAENLYMRGMFFLICCFFGLFMANYIRRYEQLMNILYVSANRFELMIGNARDMMYRMSLPKGEYEFVSKASTTIFGYAPEEFYKRPRLLDEMLHPDSKARYADEQARLLAGKEAAPFYEYQMISKAGKKLTINLRLTVYRDAASAPVAIEGIITDLTASGQ